MGLLALVGGSEWTEGCGFDAELLEASGGSEVVVLPTAAAYEHPERRCLAAAEWFAGLGAAVEGLMVLGRADAEDAGAAEVVRRARFIYLSRGLGPPPALGAEGFGGVRGPLEAWASGAVVAGSGGGAMALTDPMVDPRGGALTVGLGLVEGMAVVPHLGDVGQDAHGEKLHRSVALAPRACPWPASRCARRSHPGGVGELAGASDPVSVFVDGDLAELSALR